MERKGQKEGKGGREHTSCSKSTPRPWLRLSFGKGGSSKTSMSLLINVFFFVRALKAFRSLFCIRLPMVPHPGFPSQSQISLSSGVPHAASAQGERRTGQIPTLHKTASFPTLARDVGSVRDVPSPSVRP